MKKVPRIISIFRYFAPPVTVAVVFAGVVG
jgi:hypothetical protein